MVEINRISCGAFQNGKCILAAGLTEYDNGEFQVRQNGFPIYKGKSKRKAFSVYSGINLSILGMANDNGMKFQEYF